MHLRINVLLMCVSLYIHDNIQTRDDMHLTDATYIRIAANLGLSTTLGVPGLGIMRRRCRIIKKYHNFPE